MSSSTRHFKLCSYCGFRNAIIIDEILKKFNKKSKKVKIILLEIKILLPADIHIIKLLMRKF